MTIAYNCVKNSLFFGSENQGLFFGSENQRYALLNLRLPIRLGPCRCLLVNSKLSGDRLPIRFDLNYEVIHRCLSLLGHALPFWHQSACREKLNFRNNSSSVKWIVLLPVVRILTTVALWSGY